LPPSCAARQLKSAKLPWTEISETTSKNKPFPQQGSYLWYFVTLSEGLLRYGTISKKTGLFI
jgi:hypothetical protein